MSFTQLTLPGIGGGPGALKRLFTSSSFGQLMLWGVGQQVLGTLLQPLLQDLQQNESRHIQQTPLTPAEAAEAEIRHAFAGKLSGADEALNTGVNADRFQTMVNMTGEPLPIEMLLTALRRKKISHDYSDQATPTFMLGVRQSHLKDEWAPVLEELQYQELTVGDLVEGIVKSQLSPDERAYYGERVGIKEQELQHLVDITGNPLAPQELLTLYRRGKIGLRGTGAAALTVEQGFHEGRTKNKWFDHFTELIDYLPPPRTVTALLRSGAIDQQKAAELFAKNGLTPELAATYAASASHQKMATHKQLAEAQVIAMYEARAISEAQLREFLAALNYDVAESDLIITFADMRRSIAAEAKAITKISSLYLARKVTKLGAHNALTELGLSDAGVKSMLATWDIERTANVKVLTEAQIVAAFASQFLDQGEATEDLMGLGYNEYDAWVLLSNHGKTALPNKPARPNAPADRAV